MDKTGEAATFRGFCMNKNPLVTLLMVLLLLSVLAAAGLSFWYVQSTRRLNLLQWQATQATRNRNIVQNLANEAVEYGKRNPAIDPVLQSVGLKPKPATNAAPLPAKPTTR